MKYGDMDFVTIDCLDYRIRIQEINIMSQNPSTGVRAGDYRLNSGETIFWGKNDLGKEIIKFKLLNPHWCPMSISTFAD